MSSEAPCKLAYGEMARQHLKRKRRQHRKPRLEHVLTERVTWTACGGEFVHMEISEDGTSNGYRPPCGDCGGRLIAHARPEPE